MEIQNVFDQTEFGTLDTIKIGEELYFPATESAKLLGYSNPHDAILRHCKDGALKHEVWVQTGTKRDGSPAMRLGKKNYLSEGDLYRLILNSRLPIGKRFADWIFDEVLPCIRKYGIYVSPKILDEIISTQERAQQFIDEYIAVESNPPISTLTDVTHLLPEVIYDEAE